jgi:type III secretion system YscQ/HrcQ family protein
MSDHSSTTVTRKVQSFSLADRAQLPAGALPWTRAVARVRAAFPVEGKANLRGVGGITVRAKRISFSPSRRGGEAFRLDLHEGQARLIIDPILAVGMINTLLGRPSFLIRRLGRSERGLLGAVVASLVDQLGVQGARLSLADPGVLPLSEGVEVELEIRSAVVTGTCWLILPIAFLERPPALPPRIDPEQIAAPLVLELARTQLAAAEWASAAPGDALVFEGASFDQGGTWSVVARVGDHFFYATLEPDGAIRGRGPMKEAASMNDETKMKSSNPSKASDTSNPSRIRQPLSAHAARALGSAPVEVVAELGRMNLRGDELIGLMEGGVLSLGTRRQTEVQLRVGEQVWAIGELVTVDGELAVRITELRSRAE